jgi:hypothetical protein
MQQLSSVDNLAHRNMGKKRKQSTKEMSFTLQFNFEIETRE